MAIPHLATPPHPKSAFLPLPIGCPTPGRRPGRRMARHTMCHSHHAPISVRTDSPCWGRVRGRGEGQTGSPSGVSHSRRGLPEFRESGRPQQTTTRRAEADVDPDVKRAGRSRRVPPVEQQGATRADRREPRPEDRRSGGGSGIGLFVSKSQPAGGTRALVQVPTLHTGLRPKAPPRGGRRGREREGCPQAHPRSMSSTRLVDQRSGTRPAQSSGTKVVFGRSSHISSRHRPQCVTPGQVWHYFTRVRLV